MTPERWRQIAMVSACFMALVEIIDAPFIDAPVFAIAFAVLFLVCAWLLRRDGTVAPVLLIALALFELANIPAFSRDSAFDWGIQSADAIGSLACLVAAAAYLVARRRRAAPDQTS